MTPVSWFLAAILFVSVLTLSLSVYSVTRTVDVAHNLAVIGERNRTELVEHMLQIRAVSIKAADAATQSFHEANDVNNKLERIASSAQTESRAEDEARAAQLQGMANVGKETRDDVKEVKSAVSRGKDKDTPGQHEAQT